MMHRFPLNLTDCPNDKSMHRVWNSPPSLDCILFVCLFVCRCFFLKIKETQIGIKITKQIENRNFSQTRDISISCHLPFKMFGSVVELLNDHCPPMLQDRPRFSITKSVTRTDEAPDAAVNESPSAAITSMSPMPATTHINRKNGKKNN